MDSLVDKTKQNLKYVYEEGFIANVSHVEAFL